MDNLTPAMDNLRTWMIVSAVMYGGALLVFAFFQNALLESINGASKLLFKDKFPLIPLSSEKFWLVLTNSMMVMLVATCVFVAADVERYHEIVLIILFSKAASSLQYLRLFMKSKPYFAYLVGALTDGPLFLITTYFFFMAY